MLVHVYITYRLEKPCSTGFQRHYCGSSRVCMQNTAARIVTRAGTQVHSEDLLEQLHWLPVSFRVDYKILLLTFCALHGLAPVYLSQLLTDYRPTRTLRSRSPPLLCQPKS